MSKRYANWMLGSILGVAAIAVAGSLAHSYYIRQSLAEPELSDARQAAIQICSSVDDPALTTTLGIASCMTYIRGFVTGHSVAALKDNDPRKLICVPPSATNEQLLEEVLTWAEQNQDTLDKGYRNQSLAAPLLVIYGLQSKYACLKRPTS